MQRNNKLAFTVVSCKMMMNGKHALLRLWATIAQLDYASSLSRFLSMIRQTTHTNCGSRLQMTLLATSCNTPSKSWGNTAFRTVKK